VAALIAAELMAGAGAEDSGTGIGAALVQRVLDTHVREQLDALADLRIGLGD
jgi:hypothetical protein